MVRRTVLQSLVLAVRRQGTLRRESLRPENLLHLEGEYLDQRLGLIMTTGKGIVFLPHVPKTGRNKDCNA